MRRKVWCENFSTSLVNSNRARVAMCKNRKEASKCRRQNGYISDVAIATIYTYIGRFLKVEGRKYLVGLYLRRSVPVLNYSHRRS